jgi:methionyl-tRNA formyltransferase
VSAAVRYPYASGDVLENRNTYFFSPFQGRAFLAAWRANRDAAAAGLAQPRGLERARDESGPTATEALLRGVLGDLPSPVRRTEALRVVDRLVQRFEVTKRIHAAYNEAWRPTDPTDYRRLAGYVLFAEVVDVAFACTGAAPYLNAMIKCLDTLTALSPRLEGDERSRVFTLIGHERHHVDTLARRLVSEDAGA